VKNSQKKNVSNDADPIRSAEEKKKDILAGPHERFEIPIPGLLRSILIPVWLLTLVIPIIILIFDGSLIKILYSFIPFLGLGILIFINIKLFCPKEIITTEKGAYVMFRGKRKYFIPWDRMVLVPRKRSLVQGNEERVGIAMLGARVAIAEAPANVADALKKKKEQYSA
jgi:hypothetical protein